MRAEARGQLARRTGSGCLPCLPVADRARLARGWLPADRLFACPVGCPCLVLAGARMAADISMKSKNLSTANQSAPSNRPVLCDLVKSGMSQGSASQEIRAACPRQKSDFLVTWKFVWLPQSTKEAAWLMVLQLWLKKMTQGAPRGSSGCVSSPSECFIEQQNKDPL